jgi:serine protease Do
MKENHRVGRVALASMAVALAAAYGFNQLPGFKHALAADEAPVAQMSIPDFSGLVEKVDPAVVLVETRRDAAAAREDSPQQGPEGDPRERQGTGSGFIISSDGYVLTNAHVVAGATEVSVTLDDGRDLKGKVVGVDKRTDVALLKLDAKDLPVAKIGDPQKSKVGSWVAAIGAPFGLDHTLTAGIISAKSRTLPGESLVPFIQTDVAVNPGNSGGPLLNLNGEVIGINSQIFSRTGGFMGLSFAIPIDVAMKVKDELQQHGVVKRGRIGVAIQDVSKELASAFNMPRPEGALVSSVEKGTPAAGAGIMAGDVIVGVGGKPVVKAVDASRLIGEMKPGQNAKISLLREGQPKELSMVLAETPNEPAVTAAATQEAAPAKLGVMVRALTAEEQQKLGQESGVVVEQVAGAAARAGITRGDIIIAINNKPVTSATELKRLVESAGERAAILIERDGARRYVAVKFS